MRLQASQPQIAASRDDQLHDKVCCSHDLGFQNESSWGQRRTRNTGPMILTKSLLLVSLITCVAAAHREHLGLLRNEHGPDACLEFVRYVPSHWETLWLTEASSRRHNICGLLKQEHELSRAWMTGATHEGSQLVDDRVWSVFQYRNVCSSSADFLHFPIEPAVGLLRNPLALPCASDAGFPGPEDRSHMVLAPPGLKAGFPGKSVLFDMGSGTSYDSSLRWLVETYRSKGVEFEQIFAWEVQDINQQDFWHSVPDDMVSRLHFYNTYATDTPGLPSPLAILRSLYTQGTFVVVKLDIDNEEVESVIMQQAYEMLGMIGEMLFEKHFDAPEMRPWFGSDLQATLVDALSLFHKYRSAGLRLHYWP